FHQALPRPTNLDEVGVTKVACRGESLERNARAGAARHPEDQDLVRQQSTQLGLRPQEEVVEPANAERGFRDFRKPLAIFGGQGPVRTDHGLTFPLSPVTRALAVTMDRS